MSSAIHAIGKAFTRASNKNVLYKKFFEETQSKHVNVHKGGPSDKYTIPLVYVGTATVLVAALTGAWDMALGKNKKVQ